MRAEDEIESGEHRMNGRSVICGVVCIDILIQDYVACDSKAKQINRGCPNFETYLATEKGLGCILCCARNASLDAHVSGRLDEGIPWVFYSASHNAETPPPTPRSVGESLTSNAMVRTISVNTVLQLIQNTLSKTRRYCSGDMLLYEKYKRADNKESIRMDR